MEWYWTVLIIYGCVSILLGLISLFCRPLRIVFTGLLSVLAFAVETIYIMMIWWWLAIVKICKDGSVPRFWLFQK